MWFGTFTESIPVGDFHMTDFELDKIKLTGKLYIGDMLADSVTTTIKFSGISYDFATSGITVEAKSVAATTSGVVAFVEAPSSFYASVKITSTHNVEASALVTTESTLEIHADFDCTHAGGLDLKDGGGFDTSFNNNQLTVWGGFFAIAPSAVGLNAGTSSLVISERCQTGTSVSIGNTVSGSAPMDIFDAELVKLTASELYIETKQGRLDVLDITSSIHFEGVDKVYLKAMANSKIISFNGAISFPFLHVQTNNGITFAESSTITTSGDLMLIYSQGIMTLSGSNEIKSGANLTIRGGGIISATAPITLDASVDLTLNATSMSVIRHSLLKLKAGSNLLCDTPMTLSGSSSTQIVVINSLTIHLASDCSLSAGLPTDVVELFPICHGLDCYQDLGGMSNPRRWHLSNDELGKISTSGKLFLGDKNNAPNVAHVRIDGITYMSADAGIQIGALWQTGKVEFEGSDSAFSSSVTIYSGTIKSSVDLTVSNTLDMTADEFCVHKGLILAEAGVFATGSNDVTINTGKITISSNGGIKTLQRISLTEHCSNLETSMAIGGTSSKNYEMSISDSELTKMTSETLTVTTLGSIEIYGIAQTSNQAYVTIKAEGDITFNKGEISFKKLMAESQRKITVNAPANLSTTEGTLTLSAKSCVDTTTTTINGKGDLRIEAEQIVRIFFILILKRLMFTKQKNRIFFKTLIMLFTNT
jgi:hypothetical protein